MNLDKLIELLVHSDIKFISQFKINYDNSNDEFCELNYTNDSYYDNA